MCLVPVYWSYYTIWSQTTHSENISLSPLNQLTRGFEHPRAAVIVLDIQCFLNPLLQHWMTSSGLCCQYLMPYTPFLGQCIPAFLSTGGCCHSFSMLLPRSFSRNELPLLSLRSSSFFLVLTPDPSLGPGNRHWWWWQNLHYSHMCDGELFLPPNAVCQKFFQWMELNTQHHCFKEMKFILAYIVRRFSSWSVGGVDWPRKAAHLTVARKQRVRRAKMGQENTFPDQVHSGQSLSRLYLLSAQLVRNSSTYWSTNEYSSPMIPLPFKIWPSVIWDFWETF